MYVPPSPSRIIPPGLFANRWLGLQTPRLKRLAEIVSTQALEQQEKFLEDSNDGIEGGRGLAISDVDGI